MNVKVKGNHVPFTCRAALDYKLKPFYCEVHKGLTHEPTENYHLTLKFPAAFLRVLASSLSAFGFPGYIFIVLLHSHCSCFQVTLHNLPSTQQQLTDEHSVAFTNYIIF